MIIYTQSPVYYAHPAKTATNPLLIKVIIVERNYVNYDLFAISPIPVWC